MCEHPNREAAMLSIVGTPVDGVTTKPGACDPCIHPLVQALNDSGLTTLASCCGHNHGPGFITLADGRTLLVADAEWTDWLAEAVHDRVGCKPGRECTACEARLAGDG